MKVKMVDPSQEKLKEIIEEVLAGSVSLETKELIFKLVSQKNK
jgi:hypothetical protein